MLTKNPSSANLNLVQFVHKNTLKTPYLPRDCESFLIYWFIFKLVIINFRMKKKTSLKSKPCTPSLLFIIRDNYKTAKKTRKMRIWKKFLPNNDLFAISSYPQFSVLNLACFPSSSVLYQSKLWIKLNYFSLAKSSRFFAPKLIKNFLFINFLFSAHFGYNFLFFNFFFIYIFINYNIIFFF